MITTNSKFKVTELNPFLICVLCKGYYIDATTIIECLHSFCKTCIIKYLRRHKYCPICDVLVYKNKPLQNIRPDIKLQNVVYKLIPGLYEREMQRRQSFFSNSTQENSISLCPEDRGIITEDSEIILPDEIISIALEYLSHIAPVNKVVYGRRYLRCKASATVSVLHKFLKNKFSLSNKHNIEIICNNELVNHDLTIMDVAYIYQWKKKTPMYLAYRILETTTKRLCLKYENDLFKRRKLSEHSTTAVPEENESEKIKNGAVQNNIHQMVLSNVPMTLQNNNLDPSQYVSEKNCLSQPNNQISGNEWNEVQLKIDDNGAMSATVVKNPLPALDINVNNSKIVEDNQSISLKAYTSQDSCITPATSLHSNLTSTLTTTSSVSDTFCPASPKISSSVDKKDTLHLMNSNINTQMSQQQNKDLIQGNRAFVHPIIHDSKLSQSSPQSSHNRSQLQEVRPLVAEQTTLIPLNSPNTSILQSRPPAQLQEVKPTPHISDNRINSQMTFVNSTPRVSVSSTPVGFVQRSYKPRGMYKTVKAGLRPWCPPVPRSLVPLISNDLQRSQDISKKFKSRNSSPRLVNPSNLNKTPFQLVPLQDIHKPRMNNSTLSRVDPKTLCPIMPVTASVTSTKTLEPLTFLTSSSLSNVSTEKQRSPRPSQPPQIKDFNTFLHPGLFYSGFLPYPSTADGNSLIRNTHPDLMKAMSALYQQNPAFHSSLPPSISTLFNHHIPSSRPLVDKKSSPPISISSPRPTLQSMSCTKGSPLPNILSSASICSIDPHRVNVSNTYSFCPLPSPVSLSSTSSNNPSPKSNVPCNPSANNISTSRASPNHIIVSSSSPSNITGSQSSSNFVSVSLSSPSSVPMPRPLPIHERDVTAHSSQNILSKSSSENLTLLKAPSPNKTYSPTKSAVTVKDTSTTQSSSPSNINNSITTLSPKSSAWKVLSSSVNIFSPANMIGTDSSKTYLSTSVTNCLSRTPSQVNTVSSILPLAPCEPKSMEAHHSETPTLIPDSNEAIDISTIKKVNNEKTSSQPNKDTISKVSKPSTLPNANSETPIPSVTPIKTTFLNNKTISSEKISTDTITATLNEVCKAVVGEAKVNKPIDKDSTVKAEHNMSSILTNGENNNNLKIPSITK